MKLVIMGTGPFAVPTFRALHALAAGPAACGGTGDAQHVRAHLIGIRLEILLLVTRPAVEIKKGKFAPNPMKETARDLGYDVFEPDNINAADAMQKLQTLEADLAVVCDYGQILSPECLACTRLGGINLHGSLLPKYRGAAPVNWPIFHGDERTGISVIHMTPKLDGGPILSMAQTEIDPEETAAQLEQRLSEIGVQPVLDAIEQLSGWDGKSAIGIAQDPNLVSTARRLRKRDGKVDWSRAAVDIRNQVRAFQPWPGTYTFWHRQNDSSANQNNTRAPSSVRLILHRVDALAMMENTLAPGTVIKSDGKQLIIATGDGSLAIESIQPSGKRQMNIDEFLRGYPVQVGDRLSSEP